jgi:hypothetical protein
MTWLPISLKNAAKCDNWYQLQNHSITESLNAKGAREKPFKGDPRACHIAQCRTNTIRKINKGIHSSVALLCELKRNVTESFQFGCATVLGG